METLTTRNPVVRVETLALSRLVDAGTGRVFVHFAEEISWVRESSVTLCFEYKGLPLKEGVTLIDSYYGLFSCVKTAIEGDVPAKERHYGLSAESELEVVLRLTVKDVPVLARGTGRGLRLPQFGYTDDSWRRRDDEAEALMVNTDWEDDAYEQVLEDTDRLLLRPFVLADSVVIYRTGQACTFESVMGLIKEMNLVPDTIDDTLHGVNKG